MTKHYIVLATAFLCSAAHADEPQTSWRLIGPAFSYHLSSAGRPIVKPGYDVNDGRNVVAKYPIANSNVAALLAETAAQYCARANQPMLLSNGVVMTCDRALSMPVHVDAVRRSYNQANLELGIEYDRRDASTVQRYSVAAVVDSYYQPSLIAAAAWQRNVYDGESIRVDMGATVVVWNRTNLDGNDNLRRYWIATILPVLSVENKRWGVGANVSYAPGFRWHGQRKNVDTIMMQMTWALK